MGGQARRRPTRFGDHPLTQGVRHHGDGDTPVAAVSGSPPGRAITVTSVARVTGVSSAASRIATEPAGPGDPGNPGPPPEAVIRAVPEPAAVTTRPSTSAAPAPGPEGTPGAGAGERRRRRGSGRRELRRQETRARIVEAAADLFAERGFDAVSVAEIARRAGVVEKTVFNHFPLKEGLVFDADPPIRQALLDAVRTRPAGESAAAAAGSFVVAAIAVLGTPEAADGVATMARIVRGSRTLQIREREILGELTSALAAQLAAETGASDGAQEPWLVAHAVLGLYVGLLELARDRLLAGHGGPRLCAELRERGGRGLALLQFGLAGYAKRR
jgi:AcrR family transcriptional regulator